MMIARAVFLAVLAVPLASASAQDAKKSAMDLTRQIEKALRSGKDDEALSKIKELATIKGPEARKALFGLGIEIQIPKIYKTAIELLAGMTDEESLKFFQDEAKGENATRMVFLADVLAEMKHDRAPEILGILAEKSNVFVLRAAISALARLKAKGCVDPLIKVLKRLESANDHGQVYQEVRDALFVITSQDFDAVEDWEKWWDVSKATFDPSKKPEGATQVRKPSREKVAEFAGRKIFGRNVVFVVDTSGTMRYVQKDDIPGLSGADGSDSGGGVQKASEPLTKDNERLARYWSRMEMAKRALFKALGGFDQKMRFNIVEFNTHANSMEKSGLFPANPSTKKKALDWVKRMKWRPDGNTNTAEALEKAFAIDQSTTEIYFLSDGLPSADGKKNDPPEQILEKVEKLNRFRKVKIHTFGYDPLMLRSGEEYPELVKANEVLKRIAKGTGGTFTLLKVTDEEPPKDFKALSTQDTPERSGSPR